jgi:LmbE family N-acetylglucosaminyl deacetylase
MRRISSIREDFLRFPETDITGLLAWRLPLLLAPHPDDESLGCGGLIAAASDAGLAPVVVILTDGAASHPGSRTYPPQKLRTLREQEAHRAVTCLGLPPQNLYFLRAADTRLPGEGPAFEVYANRLREIGHAHGCSIVLAPWAGDPHCDHEAAARMAAKLCADTGWALLSYPVWGWLRAGEDVFDEPRQQGWRLKISSQMPRKQKAIAAHRSQYGGLIQDSPAGFTLPAELLRVCTRNFEIYIS